MASVLLPPTTAGAIVKRSILSKRQQRSRARRVTNLEQMRHTKNTLERVELVLRTLDDDDAVWEDFLDDDSIQVRHALRQLIVVTNKARVLTSERTQLHRLLREHQLVSAAIECIVRDDTGTKDWDWQVQHWRELTRRNYRPRTREECEDVMSAALKHVNEFKWSPDKQTSGLSYLGWREMRRVDHVRSLLQFQFYKTFHGHDMLNYVNVGWQTYTDATVHSKVIVGPHKRAFLKVLQQPRPNMMIVHRAERYPSLNFDAHLVYLVFHIQTERGVMVCVRSIPCAELMAVIDGPQNKWSSYAAWMQWEALDGKQGYKFRIGGSHGLVNLRDTHEWVFRALESVLRGEQLATGRQLLTSM